MRTALLQRRAAVTAEQRIAWSAKLALALLQWPRWRDAESVAAFVGVGAEPDMSSILAAALAQGKVLWLPRVASKTMLDFVAVTDLDALVPAPFGLREPAPELDGVRLADTGARLVLVPGLAFARDGARLGFGRGYYDRALAGLAPSGPPRVGVAFLASVDPPEGRIPMDVHDVPVDHLLTEAGLTACVR
jgi:5-formyltetrahydrofolate cyclo-ligase